MTGSEPATAVLLRRSDGTAISSSSTPSMRSSASRGRQQKRSLRKPCAATSWLRPRWIPKRSATPSTALVPQRKVGFPIPNAGLLLGFQGTKTARREGISSPFSDAGGCTSPQNSGVPPARHVHRPRPCFEDLFAGRSKLARQYDRVCLAVNDNFGVGEYLTLEQHATSPSGSLSQGGVRDCPACPPIACETALPSRQHPSKRPLPAYAVGAGRHDLVR